MLNSLTARLDNSSQETTVAELQRGVAMKADMAVNFEAGMNRRWEAAALGFTQKVGDQGGSRSH